MICSQLRNYEIIHSFHLPFILNAYRLSLILTIYMLITTVHHINRK